MRDHITVIPSDNLIAVDGSALVFPFSAPEGLHALQWHNGAGHMEFTDGRPNLPLIADDYQEQVAPFTILWSAEAARLDEEANRPPSLEEALASTRQDIKARRLLAEYGGFLFNGQVWDSEQKDEMRLNSMLSLMEKTGISEMRGWKINADTYITLTRDVAWAAAGALLTHYAACFDVEEEKKTALAGAGFTSSEEVLAWRAENLETGWPGAYQSHD